MSATIQANQVPITLDIFPFKLTDETFYEFCRRNQDYRFEMNAEGKIIVIPPAFLETSRKNNEITFQLTAWAKKDKTGEVFESGGMFTLPNGAKRAPDAFWIRKERYYALSEKEREERFARIAPDFVIELRSKTGSVERLREKMTEYVENGVRLGWLIDPFEKKVFFYRAGGEIEILENAEKISGEDVLKGFELDLSEIL